MEIYNLKFLEYWLSNNGLKEKLTIKKLVLNGTEIDNLDCLSELTNLEYLTCTNSNLTDLKGIEKLINLTDFYCQNNKITCIDGIQHCEKIRTFYCYCNDIENLYPIINLKELKQLRFTDDGCEVENIDYFKRKLKTEKRIKICDSFIN